MLKHRAHLASLPCLTMLLLAPGIASADLVLLLPAKGQVPGQVLSQTLENETRLGVLELSHTLVEADQRTAALRSLTDGQADSPEEFASIARLTQAKWVIAPSITQLENSYRLEISVYYNSESRTESVARDIDPNRVHEQVVEMMRVVLRPEGVGTAALPWEKAPQSIKSSPTTPQAPASTDPGSFFLGAGLGLDNSLKRPENAVGSTTAALGSAQLGWAASKEIQIALQGKTHLSGPRAIMLEASGRYLVSLDAQSRFFAGPELAVGLFLSQGGSKETSPMARASAVVGWKATRTISMLATLGDLTLIPASSGTLVLGGASVNGIVRF